MNRCMYERFSLDVNLMMENLAVTKFEGRKKWEERLRDLVLKSEMWC